MPLILLLDPSGPGVVRLGLARGRKLVAEGVVPVNRALAARLAGRVRSLLRAAHASPWALARVVVRTNRGNRSALRIVVTTASTLAYARGIPVVGVAEDVRDLAELLARGQRKRPLRRNLALRVPLRVFG